MKDELTLEQKAELVRDLKDLVASAGWKTYISIVQQQVLIRDALLDEPLETHDQVLRQEFMKGMRKGLKTAVDLPATVIDDLTNQIEAEKSWLPKENSDENA